MIGLSVFFGSVRLVFGASKRECSISLGRLIVESDASFSDPFDFAIRKTSKGFFIPARVSLKSLADGDEMETAKIYQFFLEQTRAQSLLLLPSWKGIAIPAFDGVVFDADGKVRYNIQIKYISIGGIESALRSIMNKVNKWSAKDETWRKHLNHLKSSVQTQWLKNILPVFGVGSKPLRKTQIVIRIKGNPAESDVKSLVEEIRSKWKVWPLRLDSVVLLTSTQAISVTEHDVHKKDWDSIGLLPADRR